MTLLTVSVGGRTEVLPAMAAGGRRGEAALSVLHPHSSHTLFLPLYSCRRRARGRGDRRYTHLMVLVRIMSKVKSVKVERVVRQWRRVTVGASRYDASLTCSAPGWPYILPPAAAAATPPLLLQQLVLSLR